MLCIEPFEYVIVKEFTHRAAPVPKADRALGFAQLQQIQTLRAQWRHPGTATDEHRLLVRIFHVEMAEGPGYVDRITGLQ